MDEKVFNALMKLCTELEEEAVWQLKDADILSNVEYYDDNYQYDKLSYGILIQLCVIAKFKHKIKSLRNYDMIVKGTYELKGDDLE